MRSPSRPKDFNKHHHPTSKKSHRSRNGPQQTVKTFMWGSSTPQPPHNVSSMASLRRKGKKNIGEAIEYVYVVWHRLTSASPLHGSQHV
eukprot:2628853-Amphidinium_carterae.1